MPNNYVFNELPSDLKTQIYGYNNTNGVQPLNVDDTGKLLTSISGGTVTISGGTVTVVGTVDVSSLQAGTVTVTVMGGTVTISGGLINLAGVATTSSFSIITGICTRQTLLVQDTSQQDMFTYYVFNGSGDTATVEIQTAPTDVDSYYMLDGATHVLANGAKGAWFTQSYLNQARVSITTTANTAPVTVYYNAHI